MYVGQNPEVTYKISNAFLFLFMNEKELLKKPVKEREIGVALRYFLRGKQWIYVLIVSMLQRTLVTIPNRKFQSVCQLSKTSTVNG